MGEPNWGQSNPYGDSKRSLYRAKNAEYSPTDATFFSVKDQGVEAKFRLWIGNYNFVAEIGSNEAKVVLNDNPLEYMCMEIYHGLFWQPAEGLVRNVEIQNFKPDDFKETHSCVNGESEEFTKGCGFFMKAAKEWNCGD